MTITKLPSRFSKSPKWKTRLRRIGTETLTGAMAVGVVTTIPLSFFAGMSAALMMGGLCAAGAAVTLTTHFSLLIVRDMKFIGQVKTLMNSAQKNGVDLHDFFVRVKYHDKKEAEHYTQIGFPSHQVSLAFLSDIANLEVATAIQSGKYSGKYSLFDDDFEEAMTMMKSPFRNRKSHQESTILNETAVILQFPTMK